MNSNIFLANKFTFFFFFFFFSGRVARAGRSGTAYSLVGSDEVIRTS